jgi:cyclic-di-GMP phosphodiesterase TipF (flagellum assembly factor)
MAQQFALDHDTPGYNPRYADAFVVFSVTILSLAIGVWSLLRLDLAIWAGAVTALAVYSVLLLVPLTVRRAMVGPEGPSADADHGDVWARGGYTPAMPPAEPASADANASSPRSPDEEIERWTQAARAGGGAPKHELPPGGAGDAFAFRPREPHLSSPAAAPSDGVSAAGHPHHSEEAAAAGAAQPEMSVELIQDLIKKLADELNTSVGSSAGERSDKPAPANATEAMISQSVAALSGAQPTPRTVPGPHAHYEAAPTSATAAAPASVSSWWPTTEHAPGPTPTPPPRPSASPPALNPQLARVAEAVAAERMEVLLEPIHALAEGRPRHFEVSVRLLTADGAALDQVEFSRIAQGSGLMPRIDAARMVRAARVARRLGERGRQGSVLAAVAGESLADEAFVVTAVEEQSSEHGMGLVLAFTQHEVRAFTPGHTEALAALASGGLRFALKDVTDLDMDFAKLKTLGFAFVELDAPVFLDGLPAAGARVPAADICRHLSDFGLSLVVGRIEDDWLLARILGFGVVFGKGGLFGAPRLVKDEVVAASA